MSRCSARSIPLASLGEDTPSASETPRASPALGRDAASAVEESAAGRSGRVRARLVDRGPLLVSEQAGLLFDDDGFGGLVRFAAEKALLLLHYDRFV